MQPPRPASTAARRHVLEPLRPALIGVSLAHLLLAGVVAWFTLGSPGTAVGTSSPPPASQPDATSLRWFRPADFQTALPLPAQTGAPPKPADTAPAREPAARSTSRYITLSRVQTPPAAALDQNPNPKISSGPARSSLDAATLDQLDRIDEALYEAFMRAWTPPALDQPALFRRIARLDITLTPELHLEQADLVVPSGSTDLDLSVLLAADIVAQRLRARHTSGDSAKFPKTLPSSFQNSRYVCRIQFQIE